MLFNPEYALSIGELLQFTTHSSLKGVVSERVFCVASLKKNRKTMVVNGEKYDIVSTSNGQWYLKRSDSFYTYVLKPISQHNLNKHRVRDSVKKIKTSINELKKCLI